MSLEIVVIDDMMYADIYFAEIPIIEILTVFKIWIF